MHARVATDIHVVLKDRLYEDVARQLRSIIDFECLFRTQTGRSQRKVKRLEGIADLQPKRVLITTMQGLSGAGYPGVASLAGMTGELFY